MPAAPARDLLDAALTARRALDAARPSPPSDVKPPQEQPTHETAAEAPPSATR